MPVFKGNSLYLGCYLLLLFMNVSIQMILLSLTTIVSLIFQGVDLRQYSKQVEAELQRIEQASIKDCIHKPSIE